ncbi:hypothetical protein [Actinomycetospora aeridis]|uniref:Uncharacterized protein n=1 Tax=Actinomycetospora aeridis TaxID=3129231 RepID=A0ABU8N1A1_9PSEU
MSASSGPTPVFTVGNIIAALFGAAVGTALGVLGNGWTVLVLVGCFWVPTFATALVIDAVRATRATRASGSVQATREDIR